MGIFGKKKAISESFIAEHRVPADREYLLALGIGLIERDGGPESARILKDPRNGKGGKYLLPMWEISSYGSLRNVVSDLVGSSRTPDIQPDKVEKSVANTLALFEKAAAKNPQSTIRVTEQQVRACTDFGAIRLEYAAYLVRLAREMKYGTDDQIWELLAAIYAEVQSRFASWTDYIISVARGYTCANNSFSFPDSIAVEAYLRLAEDPTFAYAKYPLGR